MNTNTFGQIMNSKRCGLLYKHKSHTTGLRARYGCFIGTVGSDKNSQEWPRLLAQKDAMGSNAKERKAGVSTQHLIPRTADGTKEHGAQNLDWIDSV